MTEKKKDTTDKGLLFTIQDAKRKRAGKMVLVQTLHLKKVNNRTLDQLAKAGTDLAKGIESARKAWLTIGKVYDAIKTAYPETKDQNKIFEQAETVYNLPSLKPNTRAGAIACFRWNRDGFKAADKLEGSYQDWLNKNAPLKVSPQTIQRAILSAIKTAKGIKAVNKSADKPTDKPTEPAGKGNVDLKNAQNKEIVSITFKYLNEIQTRANDEKIKGSELKGVIDSLENRLSYLAGVYEDSLESEVT